MANEEHLKIFRQGLDAWEGWKIKNPTIKPDLSFADLREAYLGGANLSQTRLEGANLSRTHMSVANLSGARLGGANLSEAHMTMVDLQYADLRGANLSGAWLSRTDFSGAQVSCAIFDGAGVRFAKFGDIDLSEAKGLETIIHSAPSTIGIDAIYKSKGNIPEVFLRGAGVPENFITYMKSLAGTEKAFEFYSCFISYSTKDQDFADRLYADLQSKGVRCWKFDENAKWGEPLWGEIDTAIRHYDKLVVICSEHSLQSPPVVREIERALQKEDSNRKNVLFPVRIDDHLFEVWDHPRKADVVSKVIGDFRGSQNLAAYSKAFTRFLDALNRTENGML